MFHFIFVPYIRLIYIFVHIYCLHHILFTSFPIYILHTFINDHLDNCFLYISSRGRHIPISLAKISNWSLAIDADEGKSLSLAKAVRLWILSEVK